MSRNGSGVYSLPAGNPVVTLTTIATTWANNTLSDIASELTNSIDKGGRTAPTANLPMAGFKHTGAGAAVANGDYLVWGGILNGSKLGLANVAVAGNFLDWYEEGTFTPTLTLGGAAVGVTYGTRAGNFTRVGNLLLWSLQLALTSKGSSTGAININGLPYSGGILTIPSVFCNGGFNTSSNITAFVSGTSVIMQKMGASSWGGNGLLDTDITNTMDVWMSGISFV